MQVNTIDLDQLTDTLGQSTILDTIDLPGVMRLYVVEFEGHDVLIHHDTYRGTATVVYPPECFDAESGGSIHDHARAALRASAANDDNASAAA